MNPVRLGYVAGIIDGEGYVTLSKEGYVRLIVASTDEALCRWLQDETQAGTVTRQYGRRHRRTGRAPAYYWRCFGRQALGIIGAVEPLLIVKKRQAAIALASTRVVGAELEDCIRHIRELASNKGAKQYAELKVRAGVALPL